MTVRRALLSALDSYIVGDANDQNEVKMQCPLHDDQNPSSSLNIESGEWFCFSCNKGMHVQQLVTLLRTGELPAASSNGNGHVRKQTAKSSGQAPASLGTIKGWHAALMQDKARLKELMRRRGLSKATIKKYDVGWSIDDQAYTIPILGSDPADILNVRFYRFDVPDDRRKIWSVKGFGTPDLYPLHELEQWGDDIVVCEGEWDCLLTLQNGFDCVTRTGSAGTWKANWNQLFRGKTVYLCHDMDTAGQAANSKLLKQLRKVAAAVYVLTLPYEVTEDHGKDLTDFWMEGYSALDFAALMENAQGGGDLTSEPEPEMAEAEPVSITVLDSFDSALSEQPVSMLVTITGKRFPTWLVPAKIHFSCDCEAPKCAICPMNDEPGGLNGDFDCSIASSNAVVLDLIDKPDEKMNDRIRRMYGIQKCGKLQMDVKTRMSVEEIFIRPSVDHQRLSTEPGDYTNRRCLSVGRHDTMPNNTVEIVGCIRPNPQSQKNELQAWEVVKTETSIENFEMTPDIHKQLKAFQPRKGQRPIEKMMAIAEDISSHVTSIYGRENMHVAMDLVFHSLLSIPYNGKILDRGWLDVLIIGDTRTGKSEAAKRLLDHYQAGEFVSCESATFAGIVGGVQQVGSGNSWTVTWGSVPLNDRRLVVLDEVSGLTTDQIAQMSSIRSSGEAQLTKIASERTTARTRLIWLGNPRNGGKLADKTYGVRSVLPLIGNNEDVARFDLVMSVDERDVTSDIIGQDFEDKDKQKYHSEECANLLTWCWSRKPDDIKWEAGAEKLCHTLGMKLGEKYQSAPPLIQAANVRIKIARIAAAIAARTFSSPDGEQLVIGKVHVQDAVFFIQQLYDAKDFGYGAQSNAIVEDTTTAKGQAPGILNMVRTTDGMYEFLRDVQSFTSRDFEDVLKQTREEAQAILNRLWSARMIIRTDRGEYTQASVLQDVIREIGVMEDD